MDGKLEIRIHLQHLTPYLDLQKERAWHLTAQRFDSGNPEMDAVCDIRQLQQRNLPNKQAGQLRITRTQRELVGTPGSLQKSTLDNARRTETAD